MKTVTAKEFQLRQSEMMKEVSRGSVYQVTYHGKPWVELHPGTKLPQKTPAGSAQAFQESLMINLTSRSLPSSPDFKALRKQHIAEKYGEQK